MQKNEKNVYNLYLKSLAYASNRPYKKRQNFDDLDDDIKMDLTRLSFFFERFPNIDIETYLKAPYEVWNDVDYYPLKFYNKRKALSAYITYKKILINLPPDDIYHLNKVIDSGRFVKQFCMDNDITVDQYLDHKKGIYSFLNHLKDGRITIYFLFVFPEFKSVLKNDVDSELKKNLFGELYLDYDIMYRRYHHSDKCKEISKKVLQKISN